MRNNASDNYQRRKLTRSITAGDTKAPTFQTVGQGDMDGGYNCTSRAMKKIQRLVSKPKAGRGLYSLDGFCTRS